MNRVVYRRRNGSLVTYEIRAITSGKFTRFGIFEGEFEIVPEDRGEDFVRYASVEE